MGLVEWIFLRGQPVGRKQGSEERPSSHKIPRAGKPANLLPTRVDSLSGKPGHCCTLGNEQILARPEQVGACFRCVLQIREGPFA